MPKNIEAAGCVTTTTASETQTQTRRQFSPKSTATEAQYDRVLRLLRAGRCSTIEFRKAGVIAPAVRIKELKDLHGYDIPTVERIDMWDEQGFLHPRIAVYELVSEPQEARNA